jgi:hypothetical protein
MGAAAAAGAGVRGAATTLRERSGAAGAPSMWACSACSSAVVSGASPPPAWWRASRLRSRSPACSSVSIIAVVGGCSWRRRRSSSVSIACVRAATSAKPKVAAPPLTECAQRKMACSVSSAGAATSSPSSNCSKVSRLSAASSKKTW